LLFITWRRTKKLEGQEAAFFRQTLKIFDKKLCMHTILILAQVFPKIRKGLSPKFNIFGRQFSGKKGFFYNEKIKKKMG